MIVNNSALGFDLPNFTTPLAVPPSYVQLPGSAEASPPAAAAKKPFSKTWPFIAAAVVAAFWISKR